MENSRIIPGMVFKRFVDSEVKNVKNAKIAVSNTYHRFHEIQTEGRPCIPDPFFRCSIVHLTIFKLKPREPSCSNLQKN